MAAEDRNLQPENSTAPVSREDQPELRKEGAGSSPS